MLEVKQRNYIQMSGKQALQILLLLSQAAGATTELVFVFVYSSETQLTYRNYLQQYSLYCSFTNQFKIRVSSQN